MAVWIVARNRYLEAASAWSEGGSVDEYPIRHWERFSVVAQDRVEACEAASKLRTKQRALPRTQRRLLDKLLAEAQGADRPDGRFFQLSSEDCMHARRLDAKGLLVMHEGMRVELTLASFNFSERALARSS